MKWYIFTALCIAVLLSLGILAVKERPVHWEGRTAQCPYCRSDQPQLARACRHCRRTFNWESSSEACKWCLGKVDVDYMKMLFKTLPLEEGEPPPALAEFPREYFTGMEEGACTYCGGLGKVKPNGETHPCPVCRGDGRCVACGGSRTLAIGHATGHSRWLERQGEWERAQRRSKLTGREVRRETMVDKDVAALRGYVEAEGLVDEAGRSLVEQARKFAEQAFKALADEHRRHAEVGSSSPPG